MATKKTTAKKTAAKKTTAKKSSAKRAPEKTASVEKVEKQRRSSGMAKSAARPPFEPPPNDNLSKNFAELGLVPPKYRGTDQFLDIVQWNIRFFHDQDPERVERIVNILSELNADIIILQEIKYMSLEAVAQGLRDRKAGYYQTAYGTTGGDQRVAIMYDLDWIRAKDEITELYSKGEVMAADGKDAFPRLPLYSTFTALADESPFDFQLVGVHLKSQRGGGKPQRHRAAEKLAEWMSYDAPQVDADVIIIGDWNEKPSADTWKPIHDLERDGQLVFESINNESDVSHLMYKNKKDIGSRLDLRAVSMAAAAALGDPGGVVRWTSLEDFLSNDPQGEQIKDFLKKIREEVSDHLPVVLRFYFTDEDDE